MLQRHTVLIFNSLKILQINALINILQCFKLMLQKLSNASFKDYLSIKAVFDSAVLGFVLEVDFSFFLNVEAEEWVCMEAHGQLLLSYLFVALL